MKFAALVSGGKDSIFSIMECQRLGHELVACVHLGRPSPDDEKEEEESYMYQTAASEALGVLVEQCIGVPLVSYRRRGRSVNTSLVYEGGDESQAQEQEEEDEVEDLRRALEVVMARFPDVEAVSSGAILSTYQRIRIESVCGRLGLTSLSPLWRCGRQRELLRRMVHEAGIDAVLVRVAAPPGLAPRRHLNRSIGHLEDHFHKLYDKFQFHVCGEGGEYETLVLDCPLYRRKLVLDDVEIVEEPDDDGVGVLLVRSCHAEDKAGADVAGARAAALPTVEPHPTAIANDSSSTCAPDADVLKRLRQSTAPSFTYLPRVRKVPGGLLHIGEIMSPFVAKEASSSGDDKEQEAICESELALQEAVEIFEILSKVLNRHRCVPRDVLMVHLYLSEMSHFASINRMYRDFFGVVLPPSRSCVGVGGREGGLQRYCHRFPSGRRVLLDCLVQRGSGAYMRRRGVGGGGGAAGGSRGCNADDLDPYTAAALANPNAKLRDVLHVQSISNWAPVCVGPYSQANTYRSSVHFLAGQIGLVPSTMTLRETWTEQLEQAWTNAARVLDALNGGSLDHMLSGLVYVATSCFHSDGDSVGQIESICRSQRETNAGVIPGEIDGTSQQTAAFMGYEDEGTMMELMSGSENLPKVKCPLLLVAIPEMPVGALAEVEIIAATSEAASCLDVEEFRLTKAIRSNDDGTMAPEEQLGWATGHDFRQTSCIDAGSAEVVLESRVVTMAAGAVVCAVSTVGVLDAAGDKHFDLDCSMLLSSLLEQLRETASAATVTGCRWLHYRLYYVSSGSLGGDGMSVRIAFYSAVSAASGRLTDVPVATMVPVDGIRVLDWKAVNSSTANATIAFAIQAFAIDPVRAETELWVHHGREE